MSNWNHVAQGLSGWVTALLNGLVRHLFEQARSSVVRASVTDLSRSKADLIADRRERAAASATGHPQATDQAPTSDAERSAELAALRSDHKDMASGAIDCPTSNVTALASQGLPVVLELRSKAGRGRQQISDDTIELIRQMVRENRLWGAERIRGGLLKQGIRVAKRTIQRYMREERRKHPASQTWPTFLKTHARDVWACDFIPVIDVLLRHIYIFFIVELETRRVVHFGVTQHLREATPNGVKPRFVLRDNDSKYGAAFDAVAKATDIEVLRTPYRAPLANAIIERYVGSVR